MIKIDFITLNIEKLKEDIKLGVDSLLDMGCVKVEPTLIVGDNKNNIGYIYLIFSMSSMGEGFNPLQLYDYFNFGTIYSFQVFNNEKYEMFRNMLKRNVEE